MKHYVYFLYHVDGALLYIGRSTDPKERHKAFMRREGVSALLGRVEPFDTFEQASAREVEAIHLHQPLYNQNLNHSGRGMLGVPQPEAVRQRIRTAQVGVPKTSTARQRMSLAKVGKPSPKKGKPGYIPTPEQCARMGASRLGKKRGPYKKKGAPTCE